MKILQRAGVAFGIVLEMLYLCFPTIASAQQSSGLDAKHDDITLTWEQTGNKEVYYVSNYTNKLVCVTPFLIGSLSYNYAGDGWVSQYSGGPHYIQLNGTNTANSTNTHVTAGFFNQRDPAAPWHTQAEFRMNYGQCGAGQ
jgi:hypothetical protein